MGAAFYDSWDGGRYPADLISGSQIQLVNKGNLDVSLVAFRVLRATS